MAQPRASKHLRGLREVGPLRVRDAGSSASITWTPAGCGPVHEWVGGFERFWSDSVGRLDEHVQETAAALHRGDHPRFELRGVGLPGHQLGLPLEQLDRLAAADRAAEPQLGHTERGVPVLRAFVAPLIGKRPRLLRAITDSGLAKGAPGGGTPRRRSPERCGAGQSEAGLVYRARGAARRVGAR